MVGAAELTSRHAGGVLGDVTGSLGALCRSDLLAVARAVGSEHVDIDACFDVMTSTWAEQSLDAAPRWSGLTLDLTPFETSVTFDSSGARQLRFTTEAQADPASATSYWESMLRLNGELAGDFGASLKNFKRVEDLYRPISDSAFMAGWHAAAFDPGRRPGFKIYLSPAFMDPERAKSVVDSTLRRLSYGSSVSALTEATKGQADWSLVSLDLTNENPRLKLYERLLEFSVTDLSTRVAVGAETSVEILLDFLHLLTEGGADPAWWYVLVYSFSNGACAGTTFHLPIPPPTPAAVVHERVARAMNHFGIDSAPYLQIVAGTDLRPSYVSIKEHDGAIRITTYLATWAFEKRHGLHFEPQWPSPIA